MTNDYKITLCRLVIKSIYATGETSEEENKQLADLLQKVDFCEKILIGGHDDSEVVSDCDKLLSSIFKSCKEMQKIL